MSPNNESDKTALLNFAIVFIILPFAPFIINHYLFGTFSLADIITFYFCSTLAGYIKEFLNKDNITFIDLMGNYSERVSMRVRGETNRRTIWGINADSTLFKAYYLSCFVILAIASILLQIEAVRFINNNKEIGTKILGLISSKDFNGFKNQCMDIKNYVYCFICVIILFLISWLLYVFSGLKELREQNR